MRYLHINEMLFKLSLFVSIITLPIRFYRWMYNIFYIHFQYFIVMQFSTKLKLYL